MKKTILLFRIDQKKREKIQALCDQLGWQAVAVQRSQYRQPLGALAGMGWMMPGISNLSDPSGARNLPSIQGIPGMPGMLENPKASKTPGLPGTPENPKAPKTPKNPGLPGASEVPGIFGEPSLPDNLGIPSMPQELAAEMMVFCHLEEGDLEAFLKTYRAAGILPIALKAVLTPYNTSWTAEQLFGELMEEHSRLSRKL